MKTLLRNFFKVQLILIILLTLMMSLNFALASSVISPTLTPKKTQSSLASQPAKSTLPTPSKEAQSKPKTQSIPPKKILTAPVFNQFPELRNGCEVTSLAMLLTSRGKSVTKMELAESIQKDTTPIKRSKGKIVSWGDPNVGFVGDIRGRRIGYGVYDLPIVSLLNKYLPDQAHNLTGSSPDLLYRKIADGKPVIVWISADYVSSIPWLTWISPTGKVRATFKEHVVLLTGYDRDYVYYNDPFDGQRNRKVLKSRFIRTWTAFGSMAVSVK